MAVFLLSVSTFSLLISKIALFMYLMNSFKLEIRSQVQNKNYVHRSVRKIKIPEKDPSIKILEIKKTVMEIQTLLWTLAIGEFIGYIFLLLTNHPRKFLMLELNAIYLLIGSVVCQMLTLMNAWFKTKTNLLLRLAFQCGLLLLGSTLIIIAGFYDVFDLSKILIFLILCYFFTSILAILTMLIDALFFDKGITDYDYNIYTRLVIILGLIMGSGIYFKFSLTFF